MTRKFNTLVLSDLHFGEDLSPSTNRAVSQSIDLMEEQVTAFLRFYSKRRYDGLPWRVVFNGDTLDFMAIALAADGTHGARRVDGHEEDRVFGLGRTRSVSVVKMQMIAKRHPGFFREVARFVARGHQVEFLCGNHDTELHWVDVQEEFIQAIYHGWASCEESRRAGAPRPSTLRERIGFHRWFFYEPGVAWIEHGHQYDENCSFDFGLNPLQPHRDEIVTNVDTAIMRYVSNYVANTDPHVQDDWGAAGYLHFALTLGWREFLKVTRGYHRFATALLQQRKALLGHRNRRIRQPVHEQRLSELSEQWGVDLRVLRSLDSLHRLPIVSSVGRLMRVLMLDRLLIFGSALVLSLILLIWLTAPQALAAGGLVVLGAFAVTALSSKARSVDPTMPLTIMPERIRKRLDVRCVVFGHTHEPVALAVEGGAHYYNTGTWIPSSKPGLRRAFTHLRIRHNRHATDIELCQWKDGNSYSFSPYERLPTQPDVTAVSHPGAAEIGST